MGEGEEDKNELGNSRGLSHFISRSGSDLLKKCCILVLVSKWSLYVGFVLSELSLCFD